MKKMLAAWLLMLPLIAQAIETDPLTDAQKVGTGVMLTTIFLDYRQTKDIKNHPGFTEKNPILGRNPSDGKIDRYFAAAALGSVAVVYLLPDEYRWYFIGGVVAMQLNVIGHNKRVGVSFNF